MVHFVKCTFFFAKNLHEKMDTTNKQMFTIGAVYVLSSFKTGSFPPHRTLLIFCNNLISQGIKYCSVSFMSPNYAQSVCAPLGPYCITQVNSPFFKELNSPR